MPEPCVAPTGEKVTALGATGDAESATPRIDLVSASRYPARNALRFAVPRRRPGAAPVRVSPDPLLPPRDAGSAPRRDIRDRLLRRRGLCDRDLADAGAVLFRPSAAAPVDADRMGRGVRRGTRGAAAILRLQSRHGGGAFLHRPSAV